MGAMATGEIILLNQRVIDSLHITQSEVAQVIAEEKKELIRREALYRVPNHHFCILSDFPGKQIFNWQQHLNVDELDPLKMPWHTCH